uniref:Leucine-rich repeat-containing protein 15-like n=1 Tax=Saccoglossus kowalevskii TaxID=10224 RepID=A0ABM0MYG0_SACKO|nr:PREDICTED: leucine-rich repeat-containing protein 15-like [Saccoglossus kowalevskii]
MPICMQVLSNTAVMDIVSIAAVVCLKYPPIFHPILRTSKWYLSALQTISGNAFVGLTELNYLTIRRHEITDISPNAFAGLTNLIQLSLYRNALTSLPETVFHGLLNLRELDISFNSLTFLSPEIFHHLSELTELDLSRNNLQSLNPSLFNGLNKLLELHLDNNGISSLPSEIFHSLSELTNLDLSGNNFQSLNSSVFNRLNKLLELHLDYNDITFLPSEIFHNFPKLTVLDLSHNKFQSLNPPLFNGLNELLELHLDSNNITFLPSEIFHNFPKLTVLDLSHNKLQSLNSPLFNGLNKLLELHLDNNDIAFLPKLPSILWYMSIRNNKFSHLPVSIMNLSNLRYLYVDNNELHHLPSFQNLTQLEILELWGNPWSCDCHMEEFMKWIYTNTDVNVQLICQYPINYTGMSITDLTVPDLQCFEPYVINTFESVYVGVNESVTLTVNVNGAPPPHIQWITPKGIYVDTDSEVNSRYRLEPDGSLFISSTQNEQAGMFVCIAENWKGVVTAVRFLEIHTPPRTMSSYATTFSVSPYTEITRTRMEYNETASTKIYTPKSTNNIKSNNVLSTGYIVSFIIGLVVGILTIVLICCILRKFCFNRGKPLKTQEENINLSTVTRTEDESHLQYTDMNNVEFNTYQQLTTTNNMTGEYVNPNMLVSHVINKQDGELMENIYDSLDA